MDRSFHPPNCGLVSRILSHRRFQQRLDSLGSYADGPSREAIDVRGIDSNDLALRVEDWPAAASLGGRGIVDYLFVHDVADVTAG